MNPQIKPGAMIAAISVTLAFIGLIFYFTQKRPAAPAAPPTLPSAQAPVRNMSPDDTVKEHRKQLPQGGGQ